MMRFTIVDTVVFSSVLIVSLLIGIFFAVKGKRRHSAQEYFLASRNINFVSASLSTTVTFTSSLAVLGLPAEIYMFGMTMSIRLIGNIISMMFAAIVIAPVFYSLNITSVYKYFELRYGGKTLRYFAVAIGMLYNLIYMATVTYACCAALKLVTGLPFWATIVGFMLITTLYTSIGGIKAVYWTDTFQIFVVLAGFIVVLVIITNTVGGYGNVASLAEDRLNAFDFRADPTIKYQFWNCAFGAITSYVYMALSQSSIQRINSTRSIGDARKTYILSSVLYILYLVLACLIGVTVFAYHAWKGCDVVAAGEVKINEILPKTLLEVLRPFPGMAGLFVAALTSAALSTISSCLSSLAAITYEDFILVVFPTFSDRMLTSIAKVAVFVYGLLALALTFLIAKLPGTTVAIFMKLVGCLDGPSVAIFVVSMLCRRASSRGILVGAVCGIVVSSWLMFGQLSLSPYQPLPPGPTNKCQSINDTIMFLNDNDFDTNSTDIVHGTTTATLKGSQNVEQTVLEKIYSISFVLFSLIGFIVSSVFGILISCLFPQHTDTDDRCIFDINKHARFLKFFKKNSDNDLDNDKGGANSQEMSSLVQVSS